MTRILSILAATFLASAIVFADSSSEFYVEEGLVAKIFGETKSAAVPNKGQNTSIIPMIGMLKPEHLIVANKYFTTDYNQIDSLPYLYFMAEGNLVSFEKSQLLWNASIGYGYLQKNITTKDPSGLNLSDTVSLQWMPVDLQAKYKMNSFLAPSISASIDVGGGRLWIHQDGNIDGFDQGHFSSYISIGSTAELMVSRSIKVLAQASYFTDLEKNPSYRGWKVGVGAWLSI